MTYNTAQPDYGRMLNALIAESLPPQDRVREALSAAERGDTAYLSRIAAATREQTAALREVDVILAQMQQVA